MRGGATPPRVDGGAHARRSPPPPRGRTQHLLHFYRAAGEAAKHKALLRGWGAACEAAGRGAPPGWPPPPPPPPPPEKEGVPVTVPDAASSSSTAVVLSLSSASSKPGSAVTALPLVGTECLLDVLCASAATLHERCLWYAQRKKHPKAAALAAGPLLGLAVRVECFALRPRPGGPGQPPALCPLPVAVADMAAQLFASCGSVGAAACAQRARLGLLVIAVGWRDTPPLPRAADWEHARPLGGGASQTDDDDDDDGEEEGAPASACRDLPPTPAQLGLTDSWKEAVKAARAVDAACPLGSPSNVVLGSAWAPPVVAARVAAAAERAISFGDGWKCVYEPPPPLPPGSEPPPRPPSADEAAAVGVGLLSVANALMAAGKAHTLAAGRAARSAARLFGPLHGAQPAQAADAAHMAGAGLYHAGKVAQAGDAFAASAAAKEALGAAAPTAEAGVAAQYVETLLFLSKTLSEQQGKGEAASNVAGKALQAARTRLGDSHGVTKKALQACMEVKRAVAMRGGS